MNHTKLRSTVGEAGITMIVLQRKLADAGLLATAAAVNLASQKLGWEAARIIESSLQSAAASDAAHGGDL